MTTNELLRLVVASGCGLCVLLSLAVRCARRRVVVSDDDAGAVFVEPRAAVM